MDRVAQMSSGDRVIEAMRRSLPHLPADARAGVASLLEPRTVIIIGATIVAWAGSHLVGVGEFVDILLLGVGAFTLGFSVFDGAEEMLAFANGAIHARSENALE